MSVTLTGAGGLFTRLGYLFGLAKKIRTHQQAIAPTASTTTTGIRSVYDVFNSSAGTRPKAAAYISPIADEFGFADVNRPQLLRIRKAATETLIGMVNDDSATPVRTITEAVKELASQMVGASASVEATTYTVGASSYGGGNIGTGAVGLSCEATKIIKDSVTFGSKLSDFPAIRPETLRFSVIKDTRNSSVNAGSEVWRVQGTRAYDNLDWRWRAGSGYDVNITTTCASVDASNIPGQNILTHSDFEAFSSNVPVQWSMVVGTAPTNLKSTTTAYRGSTALEFVGDGSTLTHVRQTLNAATGSLGKILPDTVYLIAFAIRHDGVAPAAGVLRVSINDGSSVLGSMSKSVTLSGLSSSYAYQTLVVTSPVNITSPVYCSVELTTALTNSRSVYVDELVVTPLPRPALGGPVLYALPGATDWRYGDTATIAVSYNNSGDWNLELDRFFDFHRLGLALPAVGGGAETIADSLIVDP